MPTKSRDHIQIEYGRFRAKISGRLAMIVAILALLLLARYLGAI